ncbi:hypothetical protein [Algisphaera agarilytica]|uniref:DUF3352 domain-containing protein n=1 Tax=Algisphaera agarilytica TaxID=1385975 RepID=A0A7X0HBD8_9BACT|nr:hypothetical protein [Algisphaera agarilytica]MBB6431304.1 hypothetical protein [Algisphaera agarilytica]
MIRNPLRTSFRRASAGALAFSLTASGFLSTPALAEPGSGWEALPAETVFAVRMPQTQAFLEHLRANTVAGQRIFSEEKFDQVMQLIEENNQEDWNEMVEELEEFGFTLDDLLAIAQNSWGMGFVANPRGEGELPRMVLLGWADMEEADIDRIYAAIDKAEEENEDADDTRRLDYELAGMPVRQYSSSEEGMDIEVTWDTPDDFYEWTDEQQEAHWDKLQKMEDEAQYVKIDETHLLMTRAPGRMAMAIGFPQSGDAVRELIAADSDIDWDEATDVASVQEVFANFLGSLEGGNDNSFAANILSVPEAAAAVDGENSLVEFYADGQKLLDLIGVAIAIDEGEESAEEYTKLMEVLGFDSLGVMAGSTFLADGALRWDFFAAMPSPRRGLLSTLDGQTLPAEPPAWVPAGASYFHLAYDLGKLYDVILDTVQQMAGPEAAQQVMMGNMIVQSQIQTDIPSLLRSFGTRHSIVATESQEITIETEEYDFETESFKTVETTMTMQPVAFVWDLADADVWTNVMNAAKRFAPSMGDEVQLVDEQGFTGLRSETTGLPMGFMLGQNNLVLGVGPDVVTRVLTSINNPPAVEDSLLGSAMYREGDALLNYQEGIIFAIQDWRTDMVNAKKQIVQAMEEQAEEEDQALVEQIKAVIPSDEDIRASFGVAVGQVIMTDSGLSYEAASAMPAAE